MPPTDHILLNLPESPLLDMGMNGNPGRSRGNRIIRFLRSPALWAGTSLPSRFPHRLRISRPVTPRFPPPIPCGRNNSSSITTLLNQAKRDNGCDLHGTIFSDQQKSWQNSHSPDRLRFEQESPHQRRLSRGAYAIILIAQALGGERLKKSHDRLGSSSCSLQICHNSVEGSTQLAT